jgi:hypothetical protein
MNTEAAKPLTRRQVLARLNAGEACRTGWTFNHQALFANGDVAPDRVMRRLYKDGVTQQDRDGNITIAPEHRAKPWRAVTIPASKARETARHWVHGPNGATCGWFPTREAAEQEANKRNAAEVAP